MKNKKTMITIISVVACILLLIGVTYAYWLVTKEQRGENVISSACLDISLNGSNDINLPNSFPMSDEDGLATEAYTFTVTNNCTTSIDYQVNLETLGSEDNTIIPSAIKVAIDNDVSLLSEKGEATPTLSDAYTARKLLYGTLAGKSDETPTSKVYDLRLWIDENAPVSEANKTFRSKITVTVGQTVFNPYQEGTLAYDILEKNGGAAAITSLSAEWTEGDAGNVPSSSLYVGTSYNYWYGTSYKFDKETGKYTLSGTLTEATLTDCRNGTKICGKYTLIKTNSDYSSRTIYEITDFKTSGGNVTAKEIYGKNEFNRSYGMYETYNPDSFMYKTNDDLGDSYYFRGLPTDNYVKFGSYTAGRTVNGTTYSEETPLYWRIVRINGDGTIRLAYDGTTKADQYETSQIGIQKTVYNENNNDPKYVGYTYDDGTGKQKDSTIKRVLDNWYEANLKEKYGKYIADGIFCNDREISTSYRDEYADITFESDNRLYNKNAPVLTCTNKEDRYTLSNELGNGLLKYPVGLLTADEVMFATINSSDIGYASHLSFVSDDFWLLTPGSFGANNIAHIWLYYGEVTSTSRLGMPSDYGVSTGIVDGDGEVFARPVINLTADVEFTYADGVYTIVTE